MKLFVKEIIPPYFDFIDTMENLKFKSPPQKRPSATK